VHTLRTIRVLGLALISACVLARPVMSRAESLATLEFRQALSVPADSAEGAKAYRTCAACHGESGVGSSDEFVPRIAGQHYRVVIRQLVDYRHGQRWNDRMQAATTQHQLPDAQAIANVATYVNLLKTAKPANIGTGLLVQEGVRVYEAKCSKCHGAGAQGSDGKGIPRLAGQNYGYLVRQFSDIAAGKRSNISAAHVRLIKPLQYQDIVALSDYLSQILW
jgi:cytochrome c553